MYPVNFTSLNNPAEYVQVPAIPKLGSGKTDGVAARNLALDAIAYKRGFDKAAAPPYFGRLKDHGGTQPSAFSAA